MQKGVAKELHACELHLRTSGSGIRTWCAKTHSVDKKGRVEGRPFFLILRGSNEIAMFVRGGARADSTHAAPNVLQAHVHVRCQIVRRECCKAPLSTPGTAGDELPRVLQRERGDGGAAEKGASPGRGPAACRPCRRQGRHAAKNPSIT